MDLPSWQNSPATPGGQRQAPVAGSQVPPFWQRQLRLQFLPKVPAGQAGAREGGEVSGPAQHRSGDPRAPRQPHSLWLQRTPVQPAAQSQPVPSAVQVPPFRQSWQVRLQSGPNVRSRQTATRGAAGQEPPLGTAESGQGNPRVQAVAKLNASVLEHGCCVHTNST